MSNAGMMTQDKAAHILVVDDEPELCELLSDALRHEGLRVSFATSGRAAIELARRERPDFLITDIRLGDGSGLDIIDALARAGQDVPAVVITGCIDGRTLSDAARRRPVELMTKPLDLGHLTATVRGELSRRAGNRRQQERIRRLRGLARRMDRHRKTTQHQLDTTCADLAAAYRTLGTQLALQREVMNYQNALVAAKRDDDVFRALFRLFVGHSGPVFGTAMVCDSEAKLRVAGRFGVPYPDALAFCEKIAQPIVDMVLTRPQCLLLDAGDEAKMFDPSIRSKLIGLSVLGIPLIPSDHELIGVVVLYRKGEQPFTDSDCRLAALVAHPTSLAVQRND